MSCATALQAAGCAIVAISSEDPSVIGWADGQAIATIDFADIGRNADSTADLLLSVGNLRIISSSVLRAFDVAVNFHDGPLPELAGLHAPMWAILGWPQPNMASPGTSWSQRSMAVTFLPSAGSPSL